MATGRSRFGAIRFDEPRGTESAELSRLVDERLAIDDRLDAIDTEQRTGSEDVQLLSGALAELERRAAAGDDVTDPERAKLEKQLTTARIKAAEPWAERVAGVEHAARDADQRILHFIAENLDGLLAELAEDAEAAAQAVDAAAHQLIAAFHLRMLVENRVTALCSLVRPARPGDIVRTRAEQAVDAANQLLEAGGERAPLVRADPRQPRHSAPAVDEADEAEAEPVEALA